MALRWAGVYVRARREGEKRIFSPTQSFSRLMSSSRGRTALPPSHPHAATSDAAPPATPSVTNARRSSVGVCDSVTAREPPPVPAGEHRAERGGIHGEHEDHVSDREGDEDPHDPEVPVARRLKAAEQRRQPRELHRLVNGQPGQHRDRAEEVDTRIGELLQRVVLALWRVVRAEPEVVPRHVDRAAHVARAEQQRAPLAALHEIAEVEQADGHEGPHQGEVPVQCAREPAAEAAPVGELGTVERAREGRAAAIPEPGTRLVTLARAGDHPAGTDYRAQTFDDRKYYTEQVATALQATGIRLLATPADTVYVALPNRELRPVLLSGLDYPFGYLFIDPGGPERILTGVYANDDLMDELRAYFDISDDSTAVQPRITT